MNAVNVLEGIIEIPNSLKNVKEFKNIKMIEGFISKDDYDIRKMNWKQAKTYAYNLRKGGYDDWRLPTIEDITAIFKYKESLNLKFSKLDNGTISELWSCSMDDKFNDPIHYMYLHERNEYHKFSRNKNTILSVMCVR